MYPLAPEDTLEQGCQLSSWRAAALQSLVPTHIPCSFQISQKDLISLDQVCLIRVASKLCRAPALQELSLTPCSRVSVEISLYNVKFKGVVMLF